MSPFEAIFVPDELGALLSDRAWLDACVAAERALLVARGVEDTLSGVELDDLAELVRDGRPAGSPVEPLVRALRERAGDEVHRGATSQDILDTAAMLVARDASRFVDAELTRLGDACARLAREHRDAVMSARTLLQQAVPTTFGLKAAVWLAGVTAARARLRDVAARLPAQLGGAAGTLASFGGDGLAIAARFAQELGLAEPTLPWHTLRAPVVELGGALQLAAGAAAKIAGDVVLLAQTEMGEVAEAPGGVSSTMPHKRNPARAVVALACERHARANAAILAESMRAEHERAAGAWHAEWHALTTALAATGGAVAAAADSLDGLEVDTERMRANLGDDALSEAKNLGIDAAAPEDYLGSARELVDRALAGWGA